MMCEPGVNARRKSAGKSARIRTCAAGHHQGVGFSRCRPGRGRRRRFNNRTDPRDSLLAEFHLAGSSSANSACRCGLRNRAIREDTHLARLLDPPPRRRHPFPWESPADRRVAAENRGCPRSFAPLLRPKVRFERLIITTYRIIAVSAARYHVVYTQTYTHTQRAVLCVIKIT